MQSKILIVDDEPDIEDLIKQKFRRKISSGEFQFEFAQNGKTALEKIQGDNTFAAIFTDINMPEMDGLALLEKINEMDAAFKTIVVSAYGDMNNIRTAMNRGAFDFLTKPIDFSDFDKTLSKCLNEYQKLFEGIMAKQNLERAEQEKERAEQSEKFKQQFLANMSHEIRTPLNAIKGMTLMLLKENQSEQQKKNLDIIRRSTDNLIVIINDILDLSKIEAGKLELENIDFSLQHTLDNVYELLRFKAVEKGIGFSVHTSQQVPKALKGDPVRLGQVLMNLAGNAIKFTEKGSVTITAELLATENNSSTVEISVIDTGIGIAEDQIGKVFESFSQAGKDTYRKFGGTGLGLTISKSLVEMMHGKIQLRSKYGEGTTFFFSITLPNGDESKLENDSSAESDIPKLKDIRILLFEDNLFNQIVAQQTLNSLIEGLKLEIAENGLIGIDKLKAADYDILLMDIQMPEMDGYEATKKIREEGGEKKDIAIMAMTANATKEEIQKCIASGMNDYITKPFEPNDLLRKIHKLILKKN